MARSRTPDPDLGSNWEQTAPIRVGSERWPSPRPIAKRLGLAPTLLRTPSIRTGVRLRAGAIVDLYCMHPRPPALQQDSTERDLELVLGRP